MTDIGNELRKARHRENITQATLSKLAGVSQQYISQIENQRRTPRMDIIEKLATVLRSKVEVKIIRILK